MRTKIHFYTGPGRYSATGTCAGLVNDLYGQTLALKEKGLPEGTALDDWGFKDADGRTWSSETVSTLIDANGEDEPGERFCCITFTPSRRELLAMGDSVRERLENGLVYAGHMARIAASQLLSGGEPLYYTIARLRTDSDGFIMPSWSVVMSLFPKSVEGIDEFDLEMTPEQAHQFVPVPPTMPC